MKVNKIYWKTCSKINAIDLIKALKSRYIIISIAERKNNKMKIINTKEFAGCSYSNVIENQEKFLETNSLQNMYQFYIIEE